MFDTPVALFCYNRPHLTRQVLNRIAEVKPRRLYVIADGPKNDEDAEGCRKVTALFEDLRWKVELTTLIATENMGCAHRMSSGLDWLFSQCSEAIVLEDDVLPDPSFFYFCQELLQRYADDQRIFQISGSTLAGTLPIPTSYGFSKYALPPWGWASWARAWKHYDFRVSDWEENQAEIAAYLGEEAPFWIALLEQYRHMLNSWDIQWNACLWKHQALTIVPTVNLTCNLGYGEGATFTTVPESPFSRLSTIPVRFPLKHPPEYLPVDEWMEPRSRAVIEELRAFYKNHPL